MKDALEDAEEELKRADHLLYVSMKYTRTVDVIKAIIERLISAHDSMMEALLRYAKSKNKSFEEAKTPGLRLRIIRELFQKDERILEELDFYSLLRRIMRSKCRRIGEYRRNVAMIVEFDNSTNGGGELVIDTERITSYYKRTVDFFNYLRREYLGVEEPP